MPWFEIKVTPTERKEYVAGGRAIFVFDERGLAEMNEARQRDESMVLTRAAFLKDVGRMEERGRIAVVSAHIISIEDRPDWNSRFPKGPSPRSHL